jgi:translation elongation factor P/translation initiation factor 5A
MKTGKITFITPKGKGTPFIDNQTGEQVVLDNYNIGFADGTEYKFKAKGEWKYPVGSEIQFEVSNEQYKTAKGAKPINNFTPKPVTNNTKSNTGYTTNDSIMFQVCYKANMDVYGSEHRDAVHKHTEEDFKWMSNFLNNL